MGSGRVEISPTLGAILWNGATRSVRVSSAKLPGLALWVARTVNVYVPGVVAAPTTPQLFGPRSVSSRCNCVPGGKDPATTDQLYVELPLVDNASMIPMPTEVS